MKSIKPEDAICYKGYSDPETSPDGRIILYKTHEPDLSTNAYIHHCCMLEEGKEVTFPFYSSHPYWISDDTALFASPVEDKDGEMPLRKEKMGTKIIRGHFPVGKEPELTVVTEVLFPAVVSGVSKSGRIYLTGMVNISEDDPQDDWFVVDEFPYWLDGFGLTNKLRNILFSWDRENGLRQLTPDLFTVKGTAYDRMTDTIFYSGAPFEKYVPGTTGIYRIKSGEAADEILSPDEWSIVDLGLSEGEIVFAAEKSDAGSFEIQPSVYILDPETREVRLLAELDVSYGNTIYTDSTYIPTGRSFQIYDGKIFFIATDHENAPVFSLDKEGILRKETEDPCSVYSFCVNRRGLIYSALQGQHKLEIYHRDPDGKQEQLTHGNDDFFKEHIYSSPEEIEFRSKTGEMLSGFVMAPVNSDTEKQMETDSGKKKPAVLIIHGGPHAEYGAFYNHEKQLLAARGYYVIFCNPTGSTGRGRTVTDIAGKGGTADYQDIMDFVDLVLEKYPEIDPERIGVTGISYGGFMTNWIIGHTHRFAAAVSCCSTANNITEAADKDIAPWFMKSYVDPSDPDRFTKLWDGSPLKYCDYFETPTLFMHSLKDYRCYHVESMQMYAALQYRGVPTRMILFKDDSHDLTEAGHPKDILRRVKELADWMDKYLIHENREN